MEMWLVSSVCYGVVAFISLVFGVIYLTRTQFMPYHSLALGKQWSEVESNTQTLILALMKVAGGGFVVTGITILVLLYIPFQAREQWAIYSIFAIASCTSCSSGYATFLVNNRTLGNPPRKLSYATIVLTIIGFVCSIS